MFFLPLPLKLSFELLLVEMTWGDFLTVSAKKEDKSRLFCLPKSYTFTFELVGTKRADVFYADIWTVRKEGCLLSV